MNHYVLHLVYSLTGILNIELLFFFVYEHRVTHTSTIWVFQSIFSGLAALMSADIAQYL